MVPTKTNRDQNKMSKKQSALNAFIAKKLEIDTALSRLQALSDEHFNALPDDTHWGHAGDLARYAELLKHITDSVFSEGEYAE
jgi:hypothetical protein